jgi:FkbM family methyltransferase
VAVCGSFPDIIHSYLYFFGVWEPGLSRVITRHLQPGDIVIDIGSNIGAHTMLAASIVGLRGQVYAIEASPIIFAQLKDNLEYNGLHQVIPLNVAVSARSETLTVFLHSGWNPGSTTVVPDLVDRRIVTGEMQVEARPLADIVPSDAIKAARLIKIDVEGAEWPVLRGMKELLSSLHARCIVLVEVNSNALSHFGVGLSDVLSLFRSAGWEAFEIANSYAPGFYLKPPRSILHTDIRTDSSVIDVGFCRAPVLRELLASERP